MMELIRIWKKLAVTMAMVFMLSNVAFAEETTPESEGTAENCQPADLAVPYDKFKSDSVKLRDVQIWYQFGRENVKLEDWQRAIPYFWKAVLNDKDNKYKVGYRRLTESYMALMKKDAANQKAYLDSAVIALHRGLQRYPNYAYLHYMSGSLYRNMNNTECAIPHYEALVKLDSENVNYHKILAKLLFEMEDRRCLEAQQTVIKLAPEDMEAAQFFIVMLESFGEDPLAYRKDVFLQDTTNIVNAIQFGRESYQRGNYEDAKRAYHAIMVTDPTHTDAMQMYARACEGLNDYRTAATTYKKILDKKPDDASTLGLLALANAELNQFQSAASYARKAMQSNSESGQPYIVLGHIYEKAAFYYHSKSGENVYSYDTKLVFEKAYQMYGKALKYPNTASEAEKYRNRLNSASETFFRSKADKHMKSGRETISDANYGWVR